MSDLMRGEEVHLAVWTEIVGKLRGIHFDNCFAYVKIGHKFLSFPRHSTEAEVIEDQLRDGRLVDRKISVLRTDHPSKPLLIRIETGVSKNPCLEAEVKGE